MPLFFEVGINDEAPVLAGLRDETVLTAILTFVSAEADLTLDVGALGHSDDVKWLDRKLQVGDIVTIRIVESENPAEPLTRRRRDRSADAEQERAYYEHLRRKYEPERS